MFGLLRQGLSITQAALGSLSTGIPTVCHHTWLNLRLLYDRAGTAAGMLVCKMLGKQFQHWMWHSQRPRANVGCACLSLHGICG